MNSFFIWLESSAFSTWTRESPSIFAFPAILSVHTVGMGIVAGINAMVALRILGMAPKVPLMEMKRFFPILWFGFWINAVSGVVLLIAYPTKALTNPMFHAKLAFIAMALVQFRYIQKYVFLDPALDLKPVPRRGRLLAGGSLACWAGVITAGRLLAYTYHKLSSI